ncbi:uncharacterized protein N7503_001135 [Penicillium pulvis]|uniref:uncharacterized protein n=1 Tax=Penicillium pulvis TaxID=1562058 RepID=UPI00254675EE|nr:uncharacterized protein N7503_001135 [Penicillium pulvis]KAJ5814385.1 hypothetical protein N7503_001135 [Penicillium pulvis]
MKFPLATVALAAVAAASSTSGNPAPPTGGTCNINGKNNGKMCAAQWQNGGGTEGFVSLDVKVPITNGHK